MTSTLCNAIPPALEPDAEPTQGVTPEKGSYGRILKSSALVGGSSVLNIGIGIVRTKAMALLLGPAGFGLFGLYGSIVMLTQTIAGMGINSSGVRQIAEAAGTNDIERIAKTVSVLRRVSLFLGLLGSALLIGFSRQVSTLTFGNPGHAAAVALLSVAVFCQLISASQTALVQGMRRIADLARIQIVGALFGALISIPLVYLFRDGGVAPSLVAVAGMSIVTSWWYSRKLQIVTVSLTSSHVRAEAAALLKLGVAFMSSGLMTMGVAYVVRITVLRKVGFEATGLYQSAWTLGGLYVGFILQAMGADFYPRLTAGAHDNSVCNRLVNEQAHVGLLLACPGVIGTLTFAPVVIAVLYSGKFAAAVGVLRWICLGATLQVITWPMGFVIIAKAKRALFFLSELAWTVVSLGLAWVCVGRYGLNGAGIAFFGSYVFHGLITYVIVHQLSGYRWSSENRRTGLILLSFIGMVFCGFYVLPFVVAICVGIVGLLLSVAYSFRQLLQLVEFDQLPRPVRRVLAACAFA